MSRERKPNVVIFMLDTQRADFLSCYGHSTPTTPCIDKIGEEGAVFLDNISPAIWTLPSVASMMTGVHPHSHGAGAHNDTFNAEYPTIADCLNDQGYKTTAFYANKYCMMSKREFAETHRPPGAKYTVPEQHDLSRDRVELAKSWLDQNHLQDQNPFFMFVQLMDPHLPLHPPEEFKHFVLDDATDEEIAEINQETLDTWSGRHKITERQYAILRSMLDGETAFADSLVGKLADYMREKEILDDTIFIVCSDHGDMLGEKHSNFGVHDHFTHHLCVYEELIKVPLVVRYPKTFPAGSRVENPSQTLDIYPTLAELIGFGAPHCQGFSLTSALTDKPERTFTLTEYQKSAHVGVRMLSRVDPTMDVRLYMRWLKAFRKGGMKYIWASDRHDELYDLKSDPQEQKNLIAESPEKANELRIEMENFLVSLPHVWYGDNVDTARADSASVDRMRALEMFHELP